MPEDICHDDDHQPNVNSLIEKIATLQERAKREGFISDGKGDKPMMDVEWGEPDSEADHTASRKLREGASRTAEGRYSGCGNEQGIFFIVGG